jgi:ABC-type antimicrobial peptide transport system permease subunit
VLVRVLENVSPIDTTLTLVAVGFIVAVGAAAAWLPAYRVAQVDAALVLRG